MLYNSNYIGFQDTSENLFYYYFQFDCVFQSSHSNKLELCCIYEGWVYFSFHSLTESPPPKNGHHKDLKIGEKDSVNGLGYFNKELSKYLIQ